MSAETNNINMRNRLTLTVRRIGSGNLQNRGSQIGKEFEELQEFEGERSATWSAALLLSSEVRLSRTKEDGRPKGRGHLVPAQGMGE